MLLLSNTDTYSSDWKEVVVLDGVVVDEDSGRMSASNWMKIASKFDLRIIPLFEFFC